MIDPKILKFFAGFFLILALISVVYCDATENEVSQETTKVVNKVVAEHVTLASAEKQTLQTGNGDGATTSQKPPMVQYIVRDFLNNHKSY